MELIRDLINSWVADTTDVLGFNVNTGIFDFEYSGWAVIENIECLDQYFDEDGDDRDVLLENGGDIVLIPLDQLPIEKLCLLMKWWEGWGIKLLRDRAIRKMDKVIIDYFKTAKLDANDFYLEELEIEARNKELNNDS